MRGSVAVVAAVLVAAVLGACADGGTGPSTNDRAAADVAPNFAKKRPGDLVNCPPYEYNGETDSICVLISQTRDAETGLPLCQYYCMRQRDRTLP
ncbi:MAG: hypothetical protein JNJ80_23980 [Gemmatimonadetes bacterium]|nr:hypothetical protein [Gemmatimonadota bacterium]MCC7131567.1 hypothetical protein [Gemmatimonadales bacterium]